MKKAFITALGILLTAFATTSCNEKKETGYSGTNKIYLTAENNNAVMTESDTTPLTVEVTLTSSVQKATTLTFRFEDDKQEVIHMEGNPVTIAAGEKTASFHVVSNAMNILSESVYIAIGADPAQLPEGMELAEALQIRVNPNPAIPTLTEEQKALIEGYKTKFGIDLNEFLGIMKCSTTLQIPGEGTTQDFATPETRQIDGQTIITLSEESTAEQPVLKMVVNPMGLTEYLYWVFRQNTIDDDEYWTQQGEESANQRLMDRIGWNSKSEETFNASLDGIKCTNLSASGADLEILGEQQDSYGDTYVIVPFEYSFSAWDRQKELLDKGDADMQEIYDQGGFANPTFYLFYYGADMDNYEYGNWVESKGHIDVEKGIMTFQFVMDHAYASDYTVVKVTYTK